MSEREYGDTPLLWSCACCSTIVFPFRTESNCSRLAPVTFAALPTPQAMQCYPTVWWGTSVAGVFCQENIADLQLPKDFQPYSGYRRPPPYPSIVRSTKSFTLAMKIMPLLVPVKHLPTSTRWSNIYKLWQPPNMFLELPESYMRKTIRISCHAMQ